MSRRRERTLRGELFLLIVMLVVLPLLAFAGALSSATGRAGERLLQSRLDEALSTAAQEIGTRYVGLRSALLDLADRQPGPTPTDAPALPPGVVRVVRQTRAASTNAGARSTGSTKVVADERAKPESGSLWTLRLALPPSEVDAAGILEAEVQPAAMLSSRGGATNGVSLLVFDGVTGAPLMPTVVDPALVNDDRFVWRGTTWLVARRTLLEPHVQLVAVAPLADYVAPFRDAARRGALALSLIAVASLVAVRLLTRRTTRALEALAVTADALAAGDYGRTVPAGEGLEVVRLARAFNAMSTNLRRTLAASAQRESLAAVGEFAAGLAHEVRNPLTSMRVDLQRLQEKLARSPDVAAEVDAPLRRALSQVERLDATVSSALRLARSGTTARRLVDLSVPITQAVHSATPAVDRVAGYIEWTAAEPIYVLGDTAALEQLVLNLLLNAADAIGAGGRVRLHLVADAECARLCISDTGPGISPAALERLFEPFYTTKAQGTGLGLAIARRIAVAHGGDISLEVRDGTHAVVTLPIANHRPDR